MAAFPRANFSNKELSDYIKSLNKDLIVHTDYYRYGDYTYSYLENEEEEYLNKLSRGSKIKISHKIIKEKEKTLISEEFKKIVHRWVRTHYYEQSYPIV